MRTEMDRAMQALDKVDFILQNGASPSVAVGQVADRLAELANRNPGDEDSN